MARRLEIMKHDHRKPCRDRVVREPFDVSLSQIVTGLRLVSGMLASLVGLLQPSALSVFKLGMEPLLADEALVSSPQL